MSKRLIGSDGKLTVGSFGDDLIAAAVLEIGKWYLVVGIDDTASVLPTGAVIGFMFKAVTADTLATNDIVREWTSTDMCDVQSWSLDWAGNEVPVTTFCDGYSVYRKGKDDISGAIEGVFSTDVTDLEGGFLNQFCDIVAQDPSESDPDDYKIFLAKGATMIAQLYADETTAADETEAFYLVPLSVTGFSASAGGEDAQTFSSPFRVAPIEGASMAFYKYKNQ